MARAGVIDILGNLYFSMILFYGSRIIASSTGYTTHFKGFKAPPSCHNSTTARHESKKQYLRPIEMQ